MIGADMAEIRDDRPMSATAAMRVTPGQGAGRPESAPAAGRVPPGAERNQNVVMLAGASGDQQSPKLPAWAQGAALPFPAPRRDIATDSGAVYLRENPYPVSLKPKRMQSIFGNFPPQNAAMNGAKVQGMGVLVGKSTGARKQRPRSAPATRRPPIPSRSGAVPGGGGRGGGAAGGGAAAVRSARGGPSVTVSPVKKPQAKKAWTSQEVDAMKDYWMRQGKFRVPPPSLVPSKSGGMKIDPGAVPSPMQARAWQATRAKKVRKPPRAGAYNRRAIPNTLFRKYYERGDLPVSVDHRSGGNRIKWKWRVDELDYRVYLPIFCDGLREVDEPYRFLAIQGVIDMIEAAPDKILPVVPQVIMPMKKALATREPAVICPVLKLLQLMLQSNPAIGLAIVPYYRQLLPVFNQYKNKDRNLGDGMDYQQGHPLNIGEVIRHTLEALEYFGGPDAFINIKWMIPTYQSCLR